MISSLDTPDSSDAQNQNARPPSEFADLSAPDSFGQDRKSGNVVCSDAVHAEQNNLSTNDVTDTQQNENRNESFTNALDSEQGATTVGDGCDVRLSEMITPDSNTVPTTETELNKGKYITPENANAMERSTVLPELSVPLTADETKALALVPEEEPPIKKKRTHRKKSSGPIDGFYPHVCLGCGLSKRKWAFCGWTGRPHPPAPTPSQVERLQHLWHLVNASTVSTSAPQESTSASVASKEQESEVGVEVEPQPSSAPTSEAV